jgi:predicted NBD/HSP70 family sugar kinase
MSTSRRAAQGTGHHGIIGPNCSGTYTNTRERAALMSHNPNPAAVTIQAIILCSSPLLGWRDVPIRDLLETRLRAPVTVENDVRALTASERVLGAGVDIESFALVTIGAGIGCGIFVNGGIVDGSHGVSGEIGHLPH